MHRSLQRDGGGHSHGQRRRTKSSRRKVSGKVRPRGGGAAVRCRHPGIHRILQLVHREVALIGRLSLPHHAIRVPVISAITTRHNLRTLSMNCLDSSSKILTTMDMDSWNVRFYGNADSVKRRRRDHSGMAHGGTMLMGGPQFLSAPQFVPFLASIEQEEDGEAQKDGAKRQHHHRHGRGTRIDGICGH